MDEKSLFYIIFDPEKFRNAVQDTTEANIPQPALQAVACPLRVKIWASKPAVGFLYAEN